MQHVSVRPPPPSSGKFHFVCLKTAFQKAVCLIEHTQSDHFALLYQRSTRWVQLKWCSCSSTNCSVVLQNVEVPAPVGTSTLTPEIPDHMDPKSSVGIATRYGLDSPGIESRWRRDFPHLSRPAPETTQPPVQWVAGPFPRGKEAEAWRYHPPPSSANAKERVEIYLYSLSGLRGLF